MCEFHIGGVPDHHVTTLTLSNLTEEKGDSVSISPTVAVERSLPKQSQWASTLPSARVLELLLVGISNCELIQNKWGRTEATSQLCKILWMMLAQLGIIGNLLVCGTCERLI